MKQHFRTSDEALDVTYRRKTKNEFRWVTMELIKASDYTDDSQTVMLYIRDIHNSHVREIETQKRLEQVAYQDAMTKLKNHLSFQNRCRECAEENREQKIGVLFADLNGLKIINDLYGHERGNEYILSFARTLTGHFGDADCYRISGDEFLVIIIGMEKEQFCASAEAFDQSIKGTSVPIAALGWDWEILSRIEPVMTTAEHRMYADKERFHLSHPEFQRDTIEREFKDEMNFLIHTLTESYEVLLIADLTRNSYRILRHDPTSVRIGEANEGIYAIRNDNFCNDFVSEEYRELRREMGSIENLRHTLKPNRPVICDYRLKDGQWRESAFWLMTADEDGLPVKVMYYSQNIDPLMTNAIVSANSVNRELNFLAGLRETYSAICIIDTLRDEITLHENITLPDHVCDFMNHTPYDEAQDFFARYYVAEDQIEEFIAETNLLNLRKQLQTKKAVSYFYRLKPELRKGTSDSYGKFSFCLPQQDDHTIILATKDITDIVRWTQNGFHHGENRTSWHE
ncbi:MAG: GGDEF domain-containing protein [Clostridiales bacterium]|nr:GGDEF domain-containing protein [Clostridiales bacterium]